MEEKTISIISGELKFKPETVKAVERLFADGNTIPFIARYRKERTGGLDEIALEKIKGRLDYFAELAERKKTVLLTIEKQDKLTDSLKKQILDCRDAYELEDLYLPYKPRRRTRAQVARELGLEALADRIFEQEDEGGVPERIAENFGKSVGLSLEEALKGALDILAERICETVEIRRNVRDITWREGLLKSRLVVDSKESSGKYDEYDRREEPVRDIPSHRILAILRGGREKELSVKIEVDAHEIYLLLDRKIIRNQNTIWKRALLETIRDSYERLLGPQIETEIRAELKLRADETAVQVFAENLKGLLLAPPLRGRIVIGLDPGYRTGAKLVVLDQTGKFLEGDTVYPTKPKNDIKGAYSVFDRIREAHGVGAFAVGNGAGGKETMKVVRRYLKDRGLDAAPVVTVNESGASIYSASEIAREEFPDLDLTVRGAISIGRRLQDPLAELVKVDPKSIGVGQYQHDVDQKLLARKLDNVVEFCVNAVGVDANTASVPLLSRVAGLNAGVARNIVSHRNESGPFTSRSDLMAVPRFGEKTFEQAAGFLRLVGDEPLDNSAVHPERYELVKRMAAEAGLSISELIGNAEAVRKIDKAGYLSDDVGEFTINDILEELAKPGLDPRADFTVPDFSEEINDIVDLEEGMVLEGVVTNVTKFGVFCDIGVHQDGMIHVSELDHRFVEDPKELLKVGDRLKVKVIEADLERRRIGLSRRQTLEAPKMAPPERGRRERSPDGKRRPPGRSRPGPRDGKPPREKKEQGPKKDVIASGRLGSVLQAALDKSKKEK